MVPRNNSQPHVSYTCTGVSITRLCVPDTLICNEKWEIRTRLDFLFWEWVRSTLISVLNHSRISYFPSFPALPACLSYLLIVFSLSARYSAPPWCYVLVFCCITCVSFSSAGPAGRWRITKFEKKRPKMPKCRKRFSLETPINTSTLKQEYIYMS